MPNEGSFLGHYGTTCNKACKGDPISCLLQLRYTDAVDNTDSFYIAIHMCCSSHVGLSSSATKPVSRKVDVVSKN